MAKEKFAPRFGPEVWVTVRDTGEHVKIEMWSAIASAYRARSRKQGLVFLTEEEVDTLAEHPENHLGKHWRRCAAPGCGAPLTPDLTVCERCAEPTCACGRCACPRTRAKPRRVKRTH